MSDDDGTDDGLRSVARATFPETYLTEIGRVAFEWSKLETNVQLLIVDHLGGGSVLEVVALVAHLGMRERLGALQAMLRVSQGDEKADRLTPIISKITENLSKRRNKVIHWHWRANKDDSNKIEVSSIVVKGGRFKMEPEPMSLEEVKALAHEIRRTSIELWATLEDITGKNDPSVARLFESLREIEN